MAKGGLRGGTKARDSARVIKGTKAEAGEIKAARLWTDRKKAGRERSYYYEKTGNRSPPT